ncbi:MAG: methylase [Bacteroidales bacterium]|nr:methylase [Bacteroidales bacterium]
MAWMRYVCGRLKSDYRYSKEIVYNNFPWPEISDKQKLKIEKTAQKILDVRAKYPGNSFAALYDDILMPPDLRKAHHDNDHAVLEAYGFDKNITEDEIVEKLFELYLKLLKKS